MFAAVVLLFFVVSFAVFFCAFKRRKHDRIVIALVLAFAVSGVAAASYEYAFCREVKETEIRLDELINNVRRKSICPINLFHEANGKKYWCLGEMLGGYRLESYSEERVRIEYLTNTRLVIRIDGYTGDLPKIMNDSDYCEIYSLGSAIVFFVFVLGVSALIYVVRECIKKGVE